MTTNLTELTNRIMKALVQDAYDTNDITALIDTCLKQSATIQHLASENERLTRELETAKRQADALAPFAHLQQYAEETTTR